MIKILSTIIRSPNTVWDYEYCHVVLCSGLGNYCLLNNISFPTISYSILWHSASSGIINQLHRYSCIRFFYWRINPWNDSHSVVNKYIAQSYNSISYFTYIATSASLTWSSGDVINTFCCAFSFKAMYLRTATCC